MAASSVGRTALTENRGRETSDRASPQTREAIAVLHHREGPRILASLIRLLGDFDLAEDALQEAFSAALRQWPREGIPDNPRAWLVSTGRFKAVDSIRRDARSNASLKALAERLDATPAFELGDDAIEDDRLRLIFTCCHPTLSRESQVALTLREVCGLTTEEIARGFLTSTPTIAQRIVRAKAKIRAAGIPYELPEPAELPARLENVLRVIYLVFNEGYYASSGYSLTRQSLSAEAIRLGRLLAELLPEPEVLGLLALLLLHESRRAARTSSSGDLILLEDQDRTLWNGEFVAEGRRLVRHVFMSGTPGVYSFQAAIAAIHAESPSVGETDWNAIVGLYDRLLEANRSPVVELNRAVAVAMRDGPATGLALVEGLIESGDLEEYALAHATRADLCRRLGRFPEAGDSYRRALAMATQEPERRFLAGRLTEIADGINPV